ncbi:GDP-mannose mannosyl hydrolase [Poseidonibacter ostreae]|uniref:GDP-mannose mannosyl hydrolase n=1 Tax=Poseidonibacter ostreae TaxID=2654171 RepID=A0ABQ6VPP3_9BACT|nr:GDP-mannose mannosyl hydrolase [Poseidonibacter ostreae]
MLSMQQFETVVNLAPLISIDFIVRNSKNKILLGRRINKPAKDFLFTIGGRIYKNEKIENAKTRILNDELNLEFKDLNPKFIGIFAHFYKDSFCDDNISTHYVNFAYEIDISYMQNLPKNQHNDYVWLSLDELLNSEEVHQYVKNYFTNSNCNIK